MGPSPGEIRSEVVSALFVAHILPTPTVVFQSYNNATQASVTQSASGGRIHGKAVQTTDASPDRMFPQFHRRPPRRQADRRANALDSNHRRDVFLVWSSVQPRPPQVRPWMLIFPLLMK